KPDLPKAVSGLEEGSSILCQQAGKYLQKWLLGLTFPSMNVASSLGQMHLPNMFYQTLQGWKSWHVLLDSDASSPQTMIFEFMFLV
uniref:Uncharacterized protein n=1 Tax=Megaselia scalaris TaxID=36166 RepID=T1GVT4_MEGSC